MEIIIKDFMKNVMSMTLQFCKKIVFEFILFNCVKLRLYIK